MIDHCIIGHNSLESMLDEDWPTPLMIALEMQDQDWVASLLAAGANYPPRSRTLGPNESNSTSALRLALNWNLAQL